MDAITERESVYNEFALEGVVVTFTKTTAGTYNPATGLVENTTKDYSTYGVIQGYEAHEIDGSLIQFDDNKLFLAIVTDMPEPTHDDTITILGIVYTIIRCKTIMPTGIALLYKLQVRK